MGFQILDEKGQALQIAELDKQAAEFWGKEVHPKYYANPAQRKEGESDIDFARRELSNWFDNIGYNIHSRQCTTWDKVKKSMFVLHMEDSHSEPYEIQCITLEVTNAYLKPYFDLIEYWRNKGYLPNPVK